MKKLYLILFFLFTAYIVNAQDVPFITTWEVIGNNLDITIPTEGEGYDYTIDFGDGTIETNVTENISHIYAEEGTYTVSISGDFPRIYFYNSSERYKIKSIDQWGDIQWQSMESAFVGCYNLNINATDMPDLSQVTDMSYMFANCSGFNSNINNWDVSNVTDMNRMFLNANSFNQPLANWDVSSVIDMTQMFSFAEAFNQPLNDWNVSNVTSMSQMFSRAVNFNQPLNDWDVSNVTDMREMFSFTENFNQPLNNWDVSNVIDMTKMFGIAYDFNQPLNNWDVSSVLNMESMFFNAYNFNQNLSEWNFNTDINLFGFIDNSGLGVIYYDALLVRFVELGLENISLGAHNLQYCNELIHNQLIEELGWIIEGDSLAEDCNSYNLISGNVLYDEINNGCDESDLNFSGVIVNINNENIDIGLIPNNEGNYSFYVEEGTYDVTIINSQDNYIASPETTTVDFTGTGNEEQVDFCITANETVEDLNVTLLPIEEARPGFETDYQLVVQNKGTQTVTNAEVSLTFDDTKQSFVTASQTPTAQTTNSLTFAVASIQPFQSQVIDLTMQTFEPPTVNGDDVLNFTASVTPDANDYTPEDNTFVFEQIVVNSYDPNDKQVLQGAEIYEEQTDEYLDYIIRFQNTGTASAINVRIEDELDENLDWDTFQMINASHDYEVEITDGNQVKFIFDDIHLPAEIQDEPASHGFIAFKVKPKATVSLGDIILGKSYIYFDFNEPIITNEVSTQVVEPLKVNDYALAGQVSIYPNPATDVLYIKATDEVQVESIQLYNLQGRQLFSSAKNLKEINLEEVSTGLYLLKITTNQGVLNQQILKK